MFELLALLALAYYLGTRKRSGADNSSAHRLTTGETEPSNEPPAGLNEVSPGGSDVPDYRFYT